MIENNFTEVFIAGIYTGIVTTVGVIFVSKYLKSKKEQKTE